ncbi:hypothetical protein C8R43DRAFT_916546 [Mycena crocata]|nr:hypothetical protein C8R43DRAFT_916546 [Mycena crocata]
MSTSGPPVKRQRADSTERSITRSTIWYQDGSVVLQSHDTQFRVHWSVLSQHSAFFRDMQGLPQPPDQPSIDGCPVVELSDTVADVEHVLTALYNPVFLLKMVLPLPVISALIRLGRKYEFRDLLDIAVQFLTFDHPSAFYKYRALLVPNAQLRRIEYYPGVFYDIITLARENNIFTILPCAYYRAISHHDWNLLLDGIPRGDGTHASLSPTDLKIYILGREKILQAQYGHGNTLGWLQSWNAPAGCTTPVRCGEWRSRISAHLSHSQRLWGVSDPPVYWQTSLHLLCMSCRRYAESSLTAGRIKMWETLPSFFDLPAWTELKNDL